MASSSSTVQILVNPVAGRGRGRASVGEAVRTLTRRIGEAGLKARYAETRQRGDAGQIAARCCEEGLRALVVVGGDGTVNEAAGGMVGAGVPLLVAPTGTENILAKYLGIRAEGELLWEILRSGRELDMDIGVVRYGAGEERGSRRFMLMAGVGFDAQIVFEVSRRRSELVRRGGGGISYLTYFGPVWRALWGYASPLLEVEVDGRQVFSGPALALVANVPRYAMGLRPAWRAKAGDGLLDVCVFRYRRKVTLICHFLRVFFRRHVGGGGMIYHQGRRICIRAEGQRAPMQTDGDFAGWLPAEFELDSQRLRLLAPESFVEPGGGGGAEE